MPCARRAGHDQTHERMKKIMKKFLSSLLALTMILSLVIVPANATPGAAETPGDQYRINSERSSVTLTADKTIVNGDEVVKFTATSNIVVECKAATSDSFQEYTGNDIKFEYNWNFNGGTATKASNGLSADVSWKADSKDATKIVSFSVAVKQANGDLVGSKDAEAVHVTVKAEIPLIYVSGLEFTAKVGDKDVGSDGVKEGDTVTFAVTGTPKVKLGESGTEVDGTASTYTWNGLTGAAAASSNVNWTADASTTSKTVSCKVTVTYNGKNVDVSLPAKTIKVTSKQAEADAAFTNALKQVKLGTRTYSISGPIYYLSTETLSGLTAVAPDGYSISSTSYDASAKTLTVTGTNSDKKLVTAVIDITAKQVNPTAAIGKPSSVTDNKINVGTTYTFTPSFTGSLYGSTAATAKNVFWSVEGDHVETTTKDNKTVEVTATKDGSVTITLTVTDKGGEIYTSVPLTLTAVSDLCTAKASGETTFSVRTNDTLNLATKSAPKLYKNYNTSSRTDITNQATLKWTSSDTTVATVNSSGVVTGKKTGTATITATFTYQGKTYPVSYTVNVVSALSASLDKVENGGILEFDYDDVKAAANEALPSGIDVKRNSPISIADAPTKDSDGGVLYNGNRKITFYTFAADSSVDLKFRSADGFVGDATMTMTVTGDDNNPYVITLAIPVTSAGDIKETVTGSSANSSVSFKVNDVVDYDKVYLRGSVSGSSSSRTFTPSSLASSNYDGYWDGNTKSGSGWVLFDDTDTVTIPASEFSKTTGKVTLYVVGIDDDDVAYTGTIEVSQKSYTIEYNVVAGDSVDFKQADFDDFVKNYAYDNDDRYSSRYDDIEISYVTFSLPSANTEGTLYEGKSKIARNDKIEDVDDVTFESVAKAKGTISIGFTAYGKIYKNGSTSKTNTKEFDYSGTVVISVVNEDIVYEVGVNSSVGFKASDFQSFLNTSSKRATLDYVTFDVGSNKAVTSYFSGTGALYRYYSAYGVNSTVDSKDEFYYNPKSSSKNYDLDDVTYVTSRFAKTGDIVYIPFTAYGTRNEKAEGTVAIKVKQTMNFTDVHTYDYFYDAVQWAVNKDITKGTSATTFSPKTGCTRAMIVTFLWRAADSPEPRSNSNKFTDVSATKHADYMKAILWATEQGITTGTGNNKFSPDATCTRAMIVTFLYRYKNSPAVYGSLNFTDVSKTTHSAYYNAILWAVNNKVTTGYGNGIFDPNGTCNRGDAVTFLYRALA